MADKKTLLQEAPGLRWLPNGQSILSGPLLELFRSLDRLFLGWASALGAEEHRFPPFLPAVELDKVDYFRSFPHLATFPVTLDSEESNLRHFQQGTPVGPDGALALAKTTPVRDVLTPAACYHFYVAFQGERLSRSRFVTTRAACFRREVRYAPLERQWSFSMREIVCLGTAQEVRHFLDGARQTVTHFVERIGLPVDWKQASDPFFNPGRSGKHLMQQLDPVKTEMVLEDDLAIGSVNFHHNTFGEAFDIQRDGEPVFSGCVAFGLERWILAILSRFGCSPADWPRLE